MDLNKKSVQDVIDLLMGIEDKAQPLEIVVWGLEGFSLDYSEAQFSELVNTDGTVSHVEIGIHLTEPYESVGDEEEEQPEPRFIDYCGERIELAPYEAQHRPDAQACVIDGIAINPNLRHGFDSTPNDDRDPLEISDWWDRPFIRVASWEDMSSSYSDYLEGVKDIPDYSPIAQAEYEAAQEKRRKSWFEAWPSGIRYSVRCLDGGAWDRSTAWGDCSSLDDALAVAGRAHKSFAT